MQQNYKISQKLKITKLACGATHSLGLTSSGDVLTWGFGAEGQLGHGEIDNLAYPTLIDFRTDAKMEKIYAGRNHSMCISSITFQVYTWGEGTYGQLGYNMKKANEPVVVESLQGKGCIKGCLGVDNSAVITKTGDVYVWGSNTFNKLGLSTKSLSEMIPIINYNLKNIRSISFGYEHSGAVNDRGEIFMWGNNLYGQLGLSHFSNVVLPTKLVSKETFVKVKCGSYQTIFMDKNNLVYVSGKAKLNLETENEKHKAYPYIIEDFKGDKKAVKIQAGFGNSLILTCNNDVFGFGKNDYSKAGGEINDDYVMKNPRPFTFKTHSKKRVAIIDITASYDHCFAISSLGEIFAWGNPRLNRLTENFGEEVSRHPKTIEIEWLHKGVQEEEPNAVEENEINDEKEIEEALDERQILIILNQNMKIVNFKDLFSLLKRLGPTYNEDEIVNRDIYLNTQINESLEKFSHKYTKNMEEIKSLYMDIEGLMSMRIKELGAPNFICNNLNKHISNDLLIYTDEIEKIYSLLFIHPCIMKSFLEQTSSEDKEIFMKGILPVYKEMNRKPKQCENYLAVNFIAFFRLCIEIDYLNDKNDLDNFCKYGQKTLTEYGLKSLLHNSYNEIIIFSLMANGLNTFRSHILSPKEMNSPKILQQFSDLINEKYKRGIYYEHRDLEIIFDFLDIFINCIENCYEKFSEIFIYYMHFIKEFIKKDQINSMKDRKSLKIKLNSLMMRIFFSNVIGRILKNIIEDPLQSLFVCQTLNIDYDSTFKQIVNSYLNMFGVLIERIACLEVYVFSEPERDEEDEEEDEESGNIKSTLALINKKIEDTNASLFVRFLNNFPKSKFVFEKHVISSMVYNHLSFEPHKISIEQETLVNFLKLIGEKQLLFSGEMKYKIFDLVKELNFNHKTCKNLDLNKKIKLCLNTKYLTDPLNFSLKYAKELELKSKFIETLIKEKSFSKCYKCSIILPSPFLKTEMRSLTYLDQFKNQIKREEYLSFCKILLHRFFQHKNIKTLIDLISSLIEMRKKFEENYLTDVEEYKSLNSLEEFVANLINQNKAEELKMIEFIAEIHFIMRKKISHVYLTTEYQKILQDIDDASFQFKDHLLSIKRNFDECKGNLKIFSNSLDVLEDKANIEAKLTHKKLRKPIYTNDNIFKYKLVIFNINFYRKIFLVRLLRRIGLSYSQK